MKLNNAPSFQHLSKFDMAGIVVAWPVHEHDLSKMVAQVRKSPANVWPARFAAEWDLSEDTARRIIQYARRARA
jgi:hypothetical protein